MPGCCLPACPPVVAVPDLIDRYQLAPHPEGGWYRELHRSALPVTRPDGQERSALTLILFLLAAPAVSRWREHPLKPPASPPNKKPPP